MFYRFVCHLFSQIQTTSHVGFNTIKAMIKYTIFWFLFFKKKQYKAFMQQCEIFHQIQLLGGESTLQ
jgi:hypothetical protein